METNHAKRLFHTVVVVGAAFAPGCGGKVVFDGTGGAGGSGVGNGAGNGSTAQGPNGSSSKGATASTGSSDPCQSVDPSTCASPAQYTCAPCGEGFGMKCVCDTKAPLKPTDCVTTADFHCQSYMPFTGCTCVPGSPTSASQCADSLYFQCLGGFSPPVGCDCITVITA